MGFQAIDSLYELQRFANDGMSARGVFEYVKAMLGFSIIEQAEIRSC